MNFVAATRAVESAVVAIVQKFHAAPQPFPNIWGTGFFVSEHGVICTCRHVVEKCLTLPCPPQFQGLPFWVVAWREVEIEGRRRWGWLPMNVTAYGATTFTGDEPAYVEENGPDVAFLLCEFRDTPSVTFAKAPVEIGELAAFLGYPMGLRPLLGREGFQQGSATLHAGLVASIYPNRVATSPYGFAVHANTQGGASGSPVFRDDGTVVGMAYMTVPEYYSITDLSGSGQLHYKVPTALTGCVSGIRIAEAVAEAHEAAALLNDRPRFAEQTLKPTLHAETAAMEPYKEPDAQA